MSPLNTNGTAAFGALREVATARAIELTEYLGVRANIKSDDENELNAHIVN